MDQHDLICKLKDMTLELGRVPGRDEFSKAVGGGRPKVEAAFGGWTPFLHAAGVKEQKPEKITNAVFNRDIEQHLENYEPRKYDPPVYKVSWASISDMHLPFWCKRVVDKFYDYVENCKPQYVIVNGDAWDQYAHSKFPRSHNVFTAREERALCLKLNAEFWAEIKKRHPKAKCYQMIGNHDLRPLKQILEKLPSAEDWANEMFQKDFTFDGVTTVFDHREELMLDEKTAVFHGYRSQLGSHRDHILMNTVNGHSHHGGAVFRQLRNEVLFECNSGLAGDPESKGLTYTPQKITTQTPGFAAGDKYGPRFIPA